MFVLSALVLTSCRRDPMSSTPTGIGDAAAVMPETAVTARGKASGEGTGVSIAPRAVLRKRIRTGIGHTYSTDRSDGPDGYDTILNPKTKDGWPIFADTDDSCFYETRSDIEPGAPIPMGWRGRDRHLIDCPPAMDNPVWDTCAPGELRQAGKAGKCLCQAILSVMDSATPWGLVPCPTK